ncbi:MAG: aldose 1-epimerase family protein [Clostridiales bacterium]|nr:aldose 1-epimerase family protein [Clostridiales bacterium]
MGCNEDMGNKFDKREFLKYVGDASQLFGVRDSVLKGGAAEGVRALDVRNGCGLDFTILPDRGMDIAWLSYKGINMSYISHTGIKAPQYFNDRGLGFLRNFYAGFLTTCGLSYAGTPSSDMGEELGLHGRIANLPAEEVYAGTDWQGDVPTVKIKGKIREAMFFNENLILDREISVRNGENKISIIDNVENLGFRAQPLMILYHFNLGYPLLSSKSYLVSPSTNIVPRDDTALSGLNECRKFQQPTSGYKEQVFYHELKELDAGGRTFAALVNPVLKLAVVIRFNKNQLGRLIQWKQMGEGEYVLGIEPANCRVVGRAKERSEGTLQFINPGEVRKFELEVEILDDILDIEKIEAKAMCI